MESRSELSRPTVVSGPLLNATGRFLTILSRELVPEESLPAFRCDRDFVLACHGGRFDVRLDGRRLSLTDRTHMIGTALAEATVRCTHEGVLQLVQPSSFVDDINPGGRMWIYGTAARLSPSMPVYDVVSHRIPYDRRPPYRLTQLSIERRSLKAGERFGEIACVGDLMIAVFVGTFDITLDGVVHRCEPFAHVFAPVGTRLLIESVSDGCVETIASPPPGLRLVK